MAESDPFQSISVKTSDANKLRQLALVTGLALHVTFARVVALAKLSPRKIATMGLDTPRDNCRPAAAAKGAS